VGILMLTSDYTEALEMSHRILVMRRGGFCKEYRRVNRPRPISCAKPSAKSMTLSHGGCRLRAAQDAEDDAKTGVLNPQLLSLLRGAHTNTWLSPTRVSVLAHARNSGSFTVDNVPTVLQVLTASGPTFPSAVYMAQEFAEQNTAAVRAAWRKPPRDCGDV